MSQIGQQIRNLSYRSWNVVRYHPELKQAIKFIPNTTMQTNLNGSNDILVQVLASSVNKHDIAMTRGYGNLSLLPNSLSLKSWNKRIDRLPLTLGRDFVGKIISRGPSVMMFKPGDLVWGTVPPYENGAHTDYLITTDNFVSLKPKNLSNVEAASIPYVGLTAWSALTTFGELNSTNTVNKRVLVLGGSGGVGCFAIQLLKCWGAKQVAATCSRGSIDWLQSLTMINSDDCIDYRDMADYLTTNPNRFDIILDASSSNAAKRNHQILNQLINGNGKCHSIDHHTKYVTLTSPLNGRYNGGTIADTINDTLMGFDQHNGLKFRWAYYLPNPKALAYIGALMERGAIRPLTTNVVDFDRAIDAYESLADSRPLSGKVVLNLNSELEFESMNLFSYVLLLNTIYDADVRYRCYITLIGDQVEL
ncbi:Reticulon-4-interacting protein 1, mitochondrial [Blomia tropicalis]|nr:Reticulon-4-interacting protein 1, mitochondrial [Blomia tropicalis]